jgi:imidazole glycerol phosphate synthase glutamine amidotransferase subunit
MRKGSSSSPHVGVLDYGMGNLRSVAKALETAGARVTVSDSRRVLSQCDLLALPGQGSFGMAVDVLKKKKLKDFVVDWIHQGKPYLGLCLGLQLLFESSEEAPGKKGLEVLRGRVKKFRPRNKALKVPHMGWNQAVPKRKADGFSSLLTKPDYFYFVHSFYPEPTDRSTVWLETSYGRPFCSAVAQGRLVATQFHPEKSGEAGLRFLRGVLKGI